MGKKSTKGNLKMLFVYKPKEKTQIKELQKEYIKQCMELAKVEFAHGAKSEQFLQANEDAIKTRDELNNRFLSLIQTLDDQRFSKLKTPKAILKDGKKQIDEGILYAYAFCTFWIDKDKKPFAGSMTIFKASFDQTIELWDFSQEMKAIKNGLDPSAVGVYLDEKTIINFLQSRAILKHSKALEGRPELEQLRNYLIQAVQQSLYIEGNEQDKENLHKNSKDDFLNQCLTSPYLPMRHTTEIDQLSTVCGQQWTQKTPNRATVENDIIQVTIDNILDLKRKSISISTDKLLCVSLYILNQLNYRKSPENFCYKVEISLKDYAIACGYPVIEEKKDTPEEQKKERRRAKDALRKFGAQTSFDLDCLQAISIKRQDKEGYRKRHLIAKTSMDIHLTTFCVIFDLEAVKWLQGLPIMQYPTALLAIDARNPTAYQIGYKIATQYSMISNQKAGRAECLNIKTLLRCTSLPTIEKVRAKNGSWTRQIQTPLFSALDDLVSIGYLDSWELTKAKGVPLTKKEQTLSIKNYEIFSGVYVRFKIKETPNYIANILKEIDQK